MNSAIKNSLLTPGKGKSPIFQSKDFAVPHVDMIGTMIIAPTKEEGLASVKFRLSEEVRLYRREQKRKWRERNPEKEKALKLKHKDNMRRSRLVKKHSKATRPRPEHCEICGDKAYQIAFDHCHKTNQFRGWLCHPCNRGIGCFNDDPETLIKAAAYLRVFRKVEG